MTDLPKLSPHEMQKMMNTLNRINEDTKRSHKAKARPWCGCDCDGCNDPESNSRHCLDGELGCTKKRNHRSAAELADAERYPSGRLKDTSNYKDGEPRPNWRPPRTPEQIATAGRYPNGRPIPDRSNWSFGRYSSQPRKQPETPPEPQL